MQRNFHALGQTQFDFLFIGGGIYGSWMAYEAALRGWKVALIEKNDWASGTSSSSSKLIHGGLRYLKEYDFALVKHSLAERRLLSQLAPHQVTPVRLVTPIYKHSANGRLAIKLGLSLYDFLAGGEQPVDKHRSISREALLADYPYLTAEGLKGGFIFGDCQEDDARLSLQVVDAALQAGAVAVNGARAERLLMNDDGAVIGAQVGDQTSGESLAVNAHVVINCAGPWANGLLAAAKPEAAPAVKLIKGVHLVMPPIPGCHEAFFLTARRDGRVFFVLPWYDHTLVGTTESIWTGDAGALRVEAEEADYLIEETNAALQGLGWTRADVRGAFAGTRTLQDEGNSLSSTTREFVITQPIPNLIQPIGGKYTSARADGVEVINTAEKILEQLNGQTLIDINAQYLEKNKFDINRETGASGVQKLPIAPNDAFPEWAQTQANILHHELGMNARSAFWCVRRYGNAVLEIIEMLRDRPELASQIAPSAPFTLVETVYSARNEMVGHLFDLLRRRMPLVLLVPPERAIAERVAHLVAPILGWNAAQTQTQINEVMERWRMPNGF